MKQVFLPSGKQPPGADRESHPGASGSRSVQSILPSLPWDTVQNVGRIVPRTVNVGLQVSAWGKARQMGREGGCWCPRDFLLSAVRAQE